MSAPGRVGEPASASTSAPTTEGWLRTLHDAVGALASSTGPVAGVEGWADVVAGTFADVVCVHRVDPARRDGLHLVAVARAAGEPGDAVPDSSDLLTAVHDALVAREPRAAEVDGAAALVVPVVVRGAVVGAASFVRRPGRGWAAPDDSGAADVLGALLAQPLAELDPVDRDPPETPGLEVAVVVDGDLRTSPVWVDVVPLAALRTALVVGESGVGGVQGAALAARLRSAVRALAVVDLPPDVLLRHLGDLVRGSEPGAVVTCTYAVHDAATGEVVLANAGHVPPLLVARDRPGEYGPAAVAIGAPLGTSAHGVRASKLRLSPDGLLVLAAGSRATDRLPLLGERVAALGDGDLAAAATDLLRVGGPEPEGERSAALLLVRGRSVPVEQVRRELPEGPDAPAVARRAARGLRASWGLDAHGEAVDLVVTELVTNAVRHARPPFALRLVRGPGTFVGEVLDGSLRAPVPRLVGWDEEQGRGLQLVDRLADRWGYRQLAEGKAVWFELDLAQ